MQEDELTEFGVAPPDRELQRLEPLLGNWKAEERTLDGVLGPSVLVTSTETIRWLDGGYFLVQDDETTFGDEPTQSGINWFYPNLPEPDPALSRLDGFVGRGSMEAISSAPMRRASGARRRSVGCRAGSSSSSTSSSTSWGCGSTAST
jgi:hypothetical protein